MSMDSHYFAPLIFFFQINSLILRIRDQKQTVSNFRWSFLLNVFMSFEIMEALYIKVLAPTFVCRSAPLLIYNFPSPLIPRQL